MSAPGVFARLAMRLARRIAGRERSEWTAAMAAELDAAQGHEAAWAVGCLSAAVTDRMKRDGLFLLALVAAPPAGFMLSALLMLGLAALAHPWRLPATIWLGGVVILPLAVPALLAYRRPQHVGLVGGLLHLLLPSLYMFVRWGVPVERWLSMDRQVYNLSWPFGLALGVLLWTTAAWLAASWKKKKSQQHSA